MEVVPGIAAVADPRTAVRIFPKAIVEVVPEKDVMEVVLEKAAMEVLSEKAVAEINNAVVTVSPNGTVKIVQQKPAVEVVTEKPVVEIPKAAVKPVPKPRGCSEESFSGNRSRESGGWIRGKLGLATWG